VWRGLCHDPRALDQERRQQGSAIELFRNQIICVRFIRSILIKLGSWLLTVASSNLAREAKFFFFNDLSFLKAQILPD
jgi:hypothetical protein